MSVVVHQPIPRRQVVSQGMDLRLEGLASPGSGAPKMNPMNHHGVLDSDVMPTFATLEIVLLSLAESFLASDGNGKRMKTG